MKRVVGGSSVAAQALERFPEPKVVDAFVAALSNSEDLARQMCLRSLGQIRDPRAAPAVVKSLVDKAKWTRSRAAWALLGVSFAIRRQQAPLVQVIGETGDGTRCLNMCRRSTGANWESDFELAARLKAENDGQGFAKGM